MKPSVLDIHAGLPFSPFDIENWEPWRSKSSKKFRHASHQPNNWSQFFRGAAFSIFPGSKLVPFEKLTVFIFQVANLCFSSTFNKANFGHWFLNGPKIIPNFSKEQTEFQTRPKFPIRKENIKKKPKHQGQNPFDRGLLTCIELHYKTGSRSSFLRLLLHEFNTSQLFT